MKKLLSKTLHSCLVVCTIASATQAQIRSAAPYCSSEHFTNYNMIDSMKFETYIHSFGAMGRFADPNHFGYFNTAVLPNVVAGSTATIKLKMYSVEDAEPIYFGVYIDFNRNNAFEASELVMQNSNTILRACPTFTDGDLWIDKTITIPSSASVGTTRMRITRTSEPRGMSYSSTFSAPPCIDSTVFLMGCTYDFNVNIVAAGSTTSSMAGFKVNRTLGNTPTVFSFTDTSRPAATSWKWTFTPNTITYQPGSSATSQNPSIKCNAVGLYTVKLVVSNSTRTDSVTKTNFINVAPMSVENATVALDQVFPNPTKGLLTCSNACLGAQILVLDMNGKVVFQVDNLNTNTIDLNSLPPANYALMVIKDGKQETQLISIVK